MSGDDIDSAKSQFVFDPKGGPEEGIEVSDDGLFFRGPDDNGEEFICVEALNIDVSSSDEPRNDDEPTGAVHFTMLLEAELVSRIVESFDESGPVQVDVQCSMDADNAALFSRAIMQHVMELSDQADLGIKRHASHAPPPAPDEASLANVAEAFIQRHVDQGRSVEQIGEAVTAMRRHHEALYGALEERLRVLGQTV